MSSLQRELGMAMMLITHNLGVVAQMAEEIIVMYLGKIVERADTATLFREPKHPYTQELLKSIPQMRRRRQTERLTAISGTVPPPFIRPSGCPFQSALPAGSARRLRCRRAAADSDGRQPYGALPALTATRRAR